MHQDCIVHWLLCQDLYYSAPNIMSRFVDSANADTLTIHVGAAGDITEAIGGSDKNRTEMINLAGGGQDRRLGSRQPTLRLLQAG